MDAPSPSGHLAGTGDGAAEGVEKKRRPRLDTGVTGWAREFVHTSDDSCSPRIIVLNFTTREWERDGLVVLVLVS